MFVGCSKSKRNMRECGYLLDQCWSNNALDIYLLQSANVHHCIWSSAWHSLVLLLFITITIIIIIAISFTFPSWAARIYCWSLHWSFDTVKLSVQKLSHLQTLRWMMWYLYNLSLWLFRFVVDPLERLTSTKVIFSIKRKLHLFIAYIIGIVTTYLCSTWHWWLPWRRKNVYAMLQGNICYLFCRWCVCVICKHNRCWRKCWSDNTLQYFSMSCTKLHLYLRNQVKLLYVLCFVDTRN